jgi:hypothetical protein
MKVSKIFARGVAVAALLAFCADPALAQRGKWWQDERFRRERWTKPKRNSTASSRPATTPQYSIT